MTEENISAHWGIMAVLYQIKLRHQGVFEALLLVFIKRETTSLFSTWKMHPSLPGRGCGCSEARPRAARGHLRSGKRSLVRNNGAIILAHEMRLYMPFYYFHAYSILLSVT